MKCNSCVRFNLLLLASAVALGVLSGGAAGNPSRTNGTCGVLQPQTPVVHPNYTGYAYGYVGCPNSGYSATIKLLNGAGSTLTAATFYNLTNTYPPNQYTVVSATVACAGANVRSHLYANSGGQGQSQDSGYNSDCTY